MKDQYFVSIGAGNNQVPLIVAAKSLGYSVIAIDQNPNSSGFSLADTKIIGSIFDREFIIQELRNHPNLAGLYSRSFGKAVEVANSIAKSFNLVSNRHSALRFFRNKQKYKPILQSWQVPVPTDYKDANQYIIRPATGYAKEGLRIVTKEEAKQFEATKNNGKNNANNSQNIFIDSFVEPFIENGRECILLAFVIDGSLYPVVITDRFRNDDFSDRMHVYPSILPAEVRYQMVEHCRRIVRRSKIMQGPFLAEFIIDQNNRPYLVECAPEVGGEFLADDLVPAVLGLPYFELLIQIYTKTNLDSIKKQLIRLLEEPRSTSMVIGFSSAGNLVTPSSDTQFSAQIYSHAGFYFARHLPVVANSRPNSRRSKVIALTGPIQERQSLIDSVEEFIKFK